MRVHKDRVRLEVVYILELEYLLQWPLDIFIVDSVRCDDWDSFCSMFRIYRWTIDRFDWFVEL